MTLNVHGVDLHRMNISSRLSDMLLGFKYQTWNCYTLRGCCRDMVIYLLISGGHSRNICAFLLMPVDQYIQDSRPKTPIPAETGTPTCGLKLFFPCSDSSVKQLRNKARFIIIITKLG